MTSDAPIAKAAEAMTERIKATVQGPLIPGQIGRPFDATIPELARIALKAALPVEEVARVMCMSSGRSSYQGQSVTCDEHRLAAELFVEWVLQ
jgi:hypothetical protein